ncbi:zinc-ribbon domain-containing protein [Azoarcus sp. L1K30]|uniref:DUF3426 domain-containing protein n=1 Tax=Azoarcus sp. L1K30 TaxID=2820277 RepID=UPI001B8120C2|nr:DUF3426 domain-containing protein [Azoarcus sp. L1K30]MBR0566693.1 zinc-ribbon domain-containing protein [Azoarcus sp. L1K30]
MMLTRCPACQTVFRLRAEQLRARRGEVRCGHCFNPFNALEHLIAEAPQPQSAPDASTVAGNSALDITPVQTATAAQDTPPAPAPEQGIAGPAHAGQPPETDAGSPHLEQNSADTLLSVSGAAPPRPASDSDSTQPLLSSLDFDIPDDIVGNSGGVSDMHNEPRLEDIDFSSFFEPDSDSMRARQEDREARLPRHADLPAFPPLDAFFDEHEPTPSATASADEHVDASPHPAGDASTALPDVIRAERRRPPDSHVRATPVEPTADSPVEHADEPVNEPAKAATAFEHPVADNEVETDPLPDAVPAPENAHLDATYGKPESSSALNRTLWGLAIGLLAGTFAVQAIYLFRQDLARSLPGLRPLLVAACARLGCDMPLPREAALISIETTDLQSEPGRPGRFVLHATVKNRADFLQAWPHLELTLTDANDAALARRVFTPAEWVAPARLETGFEPRGDAVVRRAFDVATITPTGYRVYVFYP